MDRHKCSYQPQTIDVSGMHMSNARPYDIVVLEGVCQFHTGDFDGDYDVDWGDLKLFADYWMNRCSPARRYCQGRDIDRSYEVNFFDFAVFANEMGWRCE